MMFEQEISHLHYAVELLQKYEKKDAESVIGKGEFPQLLDFESNIEYVRKVMKATVENTASKENIISVKELPKDSRFFTYQEQIVGSQCAVPSHEVIDSYIKMNGEDYRWEAAPHPIECLKDRHIDNTTFGRQA